MSMRFKTEWWRWLMLLLMVAVLLLSLANFYGYTYEDLRKGLSTSEAPALIEELRGPTQACRWFASQHETEHLARLEIESYDTLAWARMVDSFRLDVTVEQMRDGVGWLLDNCWQE